MRPRFSALHKLKLLDVDLGAVALSLATTKRLVALTLLHSVGISAIAYLALDALLANAPLFQTLSWKSYCDRSATACVRSISSPFRAGGF
ncbi:hypothetical protein SPRG_18021 [Saprolegnia parasitica CBS 223.65]|uniref:Uncharacterized protein n=1 Tax=Saprolegnia parasitica (strain CBS 223.65) TaxID=695850 RepID=A0A067BE99_SAPPC|nr:hypothetical protein SPRG_18021 [Saprolegnia parasitica CBS 223.65]KDO16453.1 hypothetical protein SPRG_18021 [Saprolegnia parasitica CBS 223.65]|eukprot:XP_012212839.1 hypothetical protein SPRG_18021 [Saprolegnia parasitica CBS 223.65]